MDLHIHFEKKHLILVLLIGIILCAGYALAVAGVSHSLSELQSCPAGKILKSDASGAWSCGDVSSSQWQDGSGGIIYYNGGNVGIGTVAPNKKLEIVDANPVMQFSGDPVGEAHNIGLDELGFVIHNQNDMRYDLVIDNGGKVGIGISSPGEKLDVAGNIALVSSSEQRFSLKDPSKTNTAANVRMYPSGAIALQTSPNGGTSAAQTRMYIDPNGNITVSGTMLMGYERRQIYCPGEEECTVECSTNKKLISGGCKLNNEADHLVSSYPHSDTIWYCETEGHYSGFTYVEPDTTAYAICARIG